MTFGGLSYNGVVMYDYFSVFLDGVYDAFTKFAVSPIFGAFLLSALVFGIISVVLRLCKL